MVGDRVEYWRRVLPGLGRSTGLAETKLSCDSSIPIAPRRARPASPCSPSGSSSPPSRPMPTAANWTADGSSSAVAAMVRTLSISSTSSGRNCSSVGRSSLSRILHPSGRSAISRVAS